jgi:hypothetical protein
LQKIPHTYIPWSSGPRPWPRHKAKPRARPDKGLDTTEGLGFRGPHTHIYIGALALGLTKLSLGLGLTRPRHTKLSRGLRV